MGHVAEMFPPPLASGDRQEHEHDQHQSRRGGPGSIGGDIRRQQPARQRAKELLLLTHGAVA
jgi:hypothetical protein